MTHEAGLMLVNEIAPLIQGAVPRVARPVGCEDAEELVQDALCTAARMIEAAELNGRKLYPSSIAFYAIQRTKAGRRSGYAGEMDALSSAARLQRHVEVEAMEAPVGADDEDSTLHDVLADSGAEDPAQVAARDIDWAELVLELNARDLAVLQMAGGAVSGRRLSRKLGLTPGRITQLKRELGQQIKRRWGNSVLADAVAEPGWLRRDVRTARERRACRWERAE